MEKRLFTSESVTEGHPDKVCDAISDAILDACMEKDPMSRVACETAVCTGFALVTGEITTNAYVDIQKIVGEYANEHHGNKVRKEDDGLRDAHKALASQIVQKQRAENLSDVSKQDKRQIVEQRFYC